MCVLCVCLCVCVNFCKNTCWLCSRFLNGDNEMKRIFGSKVVKLAQRYNLHACVLPTLFPYWTFAYIASSVATIRATIEPQSKPSCYYFVLLMMVMINSMVTPRDTWPRLEKLGVCDDIFIHITTSCMGLKIMLPVTDRPFLTHFSYIAEQSPFS